MALKRITPGLSDTTLFTTVNRDYKDVDLSFASKPGTTFDDGIKRGDVYKKVDIRSVEQSIRNILLTNFYEKPFQPLFGANLRRLLFELDTTISEPEINRMVTSAITRWEPRVKVLDVEIFLPQSERKVPKGIHDVFFYATTSNEAARHSLIVTVYARILNTGQQIATSVNMNRIR